MSRSNLGTAAVVCRLSVIIGMVCAPSASAQLAKFEPPRLLWERTFDRGIAGVGVDRSPLVNKEGKTIPRLKWVCFRQPWLRWGELPELRWFGQGNELVEKPLRAFVRASADGRFLMAVDGDVLGNKDFRYRLIDWNGRNIWEMRSESWFSTAVRRDGSAVFIGTSRSHERALGPIKFTNARGRVVGTYDSLRFREFPLYSISENFLALTHRTWTEGPKAYLFDRRGHLVWKREWDERTGIIGPVVVSDSGDVLLLIRDSRQALVYDRSGSVRDSFSIAPAVNPQARSYGNLAFISMWAYYPDGAGNRFLCYDFEEKRVSFLLEDTTHSFGNFDVDIEEGLVAVAIHRQSPVSWERGLVGVNIYDLDGVFQTRLPAESSLNPRFFWIKLLDGAVLVAEGDKLKLYASPQR